MSIFVFMGSRSAFDWDQMYSGQNKRRVSLPRYPFAKERVLDRGSGKKPEDIEPYNKIFSPFIA